jgi:hypothetical protein
MTSKKKVYILDWLSTVDRIISTLVIPLKKLLVGFELL